MWLSTAMSSIVNEWSFLQGSLREYLSVIFETADGESLKRLIGSQVKLRPRCMSPRNFVF